MIGIELVADKISKKRFLDDTLQELVAAALRRGLIIRGRDSRLALCPPLIVSEADAMQMLDILYPLIRDLCS